MKDNPNCEFFAGSELKPEHINFLKENNVYCETGEDSYVNYLAQLDDPFQVIDLIGFIFKDNTCVGYSVISRDKRGRRCDVYIVPACRKCGFGKMILCETLSRFVMTINDKERRTQGIDMIYGRDDVARKLFQSINIPHCYLHRGGNGFFTLK